MVVVTKDGDTAVATVAIVNTRDKGSVKVVKVDASNISVKLSGAVFTLYTDEQCSTVYAAMPATNVNGESVLADVPTGSYWVKETTAPTDYRLSSAVYPVTIEANKTAVVNGTYVANAKHTGGLKVVKVDKDDTSKKLSGAVFTIYSDSTCTDKLQDMPQTDENGVSECSGIAIGTYYVKETTAPEGYAPKDTVYTVHITTDAITTVGGASITNEKLVGGIKVVKADAASKAVKLSGAVFAVYSDSSCLSKVADMPATGSDGTSQILNLPIGNYFVKETAAPDGYVANDTVYPVTVASGATATVNGNNGGIVGNIRALGSLKVVKVDADDTGKLLSGAVFAVYKDPECTDMYIDLPATDANGESTLSHIPTGSYWVKETTAPADYVLSGTVYSITITEDSTAIVNGDVVTNTKRITAGSITLTKCETGNTSNKLMGAIYTLYSDAGCSTKIADMPATDVNGVSTLGGITEGNYFVKETTPPNGYRISDEVYSVTVIAEQTVSVNGGTVTDEKQVGSLSLTKVDAADSSKKLSGALFAIYSDSFCATKLYDMPATDANGETAYSNIPAGTYYVKETQAPAGYSPSSTVYTAVVSDRQNMIIGGAPIANSRNIGELEIKKTVEGNFGDRNAFFHFSITFGNLPSDCPSEFSYSGSHTGTISSGGGTLELKHGENAVITGIPEGVTYAVTEAEEGQNGYATSWTNKSGAVTKDTKINVSCENTKQLELGSLKLTKKVQGTGASKTKDFTFTITFTGDDLPYEFSYSGSKSGTFVNGGTITLMFSVK